MLIKRLVEYTERLDLPPAMYAEIPVKWLIELTIEGKFLGFTKTTSGKKNDRGLEQLVPTLTRSVAIKPKLLCDNGEYVLGLARPNSKQERVDECHAAFKTLVLQCAEVTKESSVLAVQHFLFHFFPANLNMPDDFSVADSIMFRVDNILPVDLLSVRKFWATYTVGSDTDQPESMHCLVCNKYRPPTDRMPIKIKRIPEGQTAGTTLVSANRQAFESYGLHASLIAPMCHECAELHAKAINELIKDKNTSIFLGPIVYVFWTKKENNISWANLLTKPQAEDVQRLLSGGFTGQSAIVEDDAFYATAFSASGGRAVTRDWLETTVPAARERLARWFSLQLIVNPDGVASDPISISRLAASLLPKMRKDKTVNISKNLPPSIARVLISSVFHGGSMPDWVLSRAIARNRIEQAVTRPRAALIKMVLLSTKHHVKEDNMVKLDNELKDPGYLCGRLLAVLESIQSAALGKTNTTVTGRFYGTASSAPASVFPRLMRGAQAHLGKLKTIKPAWHGALQRKIEEVTTDLPGFPLVLNMRAQGLFALGYYHQRAADRAARSAAAEEKKKNLNNSKGIEE